MTKFAPSVLIDGVTYTPKGWEWILAFAIRKCEWAVDEATKPEFREIVRKDLLNSKIEMLQRSISMKKRDIELMEDKLKELQNLTFSRRIEFDLPESDEVEEGYDRSIKEVLDIIDNLNGRRT